MKKLNKIETAINRAYVAALASPLNIKLAPKVKIVVEATINLSTMWTKLASSSNGRNIVTSEPNGLKSKNAMRELEILSWGFPHAKIEFIVGGKKQKLPIV